MQLKIYQVDAFTKQLFGGNPAAVCPLENWLDDALMQNIALENNLSETAFYVPKGNDFELRWFTPAIEVQLCGHATLATAHVLFQHENYQKAQIRFHTKSGILTVSKNEDGSYLMDFPADVATPIDTPIEVQEGLNIKPIATLKGKDDYLVILENQAQVSGLAPDFKLLSTLPSRGFVVTAPGNATDFVSRCFFPQAGVDEDPVTGSAHTVMTPYWANRLNKTKLTAQQISARQGHLQCELDGDRVKLVGQAITYLSGTIYT